MSSLNGKNFKVRCEYHLVKAETISISELCIFVFFCDCFLSFHQNYWKLMLCFLISWRQTSWMLFYVFIVNLFSHSLIKPIWIYQFTANWNKIYLLDHRVLYQVCWTNSSVHVSLSFKQTIEVSTCSSFQE